MNYEVQFTKAAERQIKKLPRHGREQVFALAASLAENPRPRGVVKLTNRTGWRARPGNYRVIYTIEDEHLLVTGIRAGNRRDIYDR